MLRSHYFITQTVDIPWFQNVEKPLELTTDMKIIAESSWENALKRAGSNASSNAWMEGRGLQTRYIGLNHKQEYRKWNDYVAEAHDVLEPEVFVRADATINSLVEVTHIEGGEEYLRHQVHWDLVNAYMEYMYSHLLPPRFYGLLLEVYKAGHFPCGWDEVWPDGKLWVY